MKMNIMFNKNALAEIIENDEEIEMILRCKIEDVVDEILEHRSINRIKNEVAKSVITPTQVVKHQVEKADYSSIKEKVTLYSKKLDEQLETEEREYFYNKGKGTCTNEYEQFYHKLLADVEEKQKMIKLLNEIFS